MVNIYFNHIGWIKVNGVISSYDEEHVRNAINSYDFIHKL